MTKNVAIKNTASIQPDASAINTAHTTIEFNSTNSSPVISTSGLVDAIDLPANFLDGEYLKPKEATDDKKNNTPQLDEMIKMTQDENTKSDKVKTVLQNLQQLRNRLKVDETDNIVEKNNNANLKANINIAANETNLMPPIISTTESNHKTEPDRKIESDCKNESAVKTEVVSGDLCETSVESNIFCNKNIRVEKRSPEERLMEFSTDDVPLFEDVCKLRLVTDKTPEKKLSNNNLTDNKTENQSDKITTNNSTPDNLLANNSVIDTNNLIAINIVTKNHETNVTDKEERKILTDKQTDDQNNTLENKQGTTQKIEQDTTRIIVTENNDDNKPLILSLFKGDDSSVGVNNVSAAGGIAANVAAGKELIITYGLEKSYCKSKLKIPVLNGVNFSANSGEFVSVTGQSGSGKSTFLHLMGTLDKPDAGEIFFDGMRIDNLPMAARDRLRNRSIGFIFQFYNLLPEFTALENVLSPLMIRNGVIKYLAYRRGYIEKAKALLDKVGLFHRLKHRPNELSGGEIQRVAIARSLIIEPKLLLADEPTGNLDSASAKEVIRILRVLNEENNLTIVMVTHDNTIAATADRIVRMTDGVII
ncbi:MAG: ABC transporter ATP-binding protein [Planctomycetaceae bacterium]|jgi:lipoprotein-releasing system ATP-binding protein|nr:ABC transporter ATP-binding protein [Planctomycetaceae bacterium]